jgi:hypothetical protein
MVIVAVPVANSMKVQELIGQMNEFFCLCYKAEVLKGVEKFNRRKQAQEASWD